MYLDHISLAPWRIAFTELYVNVLPSAFIEGDYKKHQYEIHYCFYWENVDIPTCNSTQLSLIKNPYNIVLKREFSVGKVFFFLKKFMLPFLIKEKHPLPPQAKINWGRQKAQNLKLSTASYELQLTFWPRYLQSIFLHSDFLPLFLKYFIII